MIATDVPRKWQRSVWKKGRLYVCKKIHAVLTFESCRYQNKNGNSPICRDCKLPENEWRE